MNSPVRSLMLLGVFAAFSASPVPAKNCKNSQPCGNSCISWSKTCRIESPPAARQPAYSPSTTSQPAAAKPSSVSQLSLYGPNQPPSEFQTVVTVQLLLTALGFDGGVPGGTLTPEARAAIKVFQAGAFLPQTGTVDGDLVVRLSQAVRDRAVARPR